MEEKAETSQRRTNKPLMEKRRRARINMCLGELKNLVLMAMNKDNSQFSKLEKADILEMAVKYLRHVQSSSFATAAAESTVMAKYQMGYGECAREVMTCLGQNQQVGEELRNRISDHLTKCLFGVHSAQSQAMAMRGFQTIPMLHQQIGDGRIVAAPGRMPYPGHSVLGVAPDTGFPSSVVSRVVKQEPVAQAQPQNLSMGFLNGEALKDAKREPPPTAGTSAPGESFGRRGLPRTSPIPAANQPPPPAPVFPPRGSTSASFTLGNGGAFPSPSSSRESDGKCASRKRPLSRDGNTPYKLSPSPSNMASTKQRRLATNYSSAANQKPTDESVWRPW